MCCSNIVIDHTKETMMSKSITLDARKVIKYINDSAQSQLVIIREAIEKLGEKVGQKYSLVAMHQKNVMFEDKSGQYYIADYSRSKGSRINFSKITKVNIEESKKSHIFNNACIDLVESVSKDDHKGSEIAFRKLESCRFRSTVASSDGYVTTRDGKRKKLVAESSVASEDTIKLIVEAVSKAMQENIIVEDNQIVGAKIGNVDIKLPITETTRRCNVAKKMKTIAEDAWQSTKFQKFINNVAGMVSKNMIKEAVVESTKFLKEYQEFSLLNLTEMETLVENTLALANQYNPILAENTALLLYKTNTKANKDDILNAWEKTARIAANPALLEDVFNLSRSKDFNNDYQEFLHKVLTEETKIPEDFLKKFLLVIKKMLKDEIETLEGNKQEMIDSDETSSAIGDLLGTDNDEIEVEGEMAVESKTRNGCIIEDEDPVLAKYKRAYEDIEQMISGVDAGDVEQVQAATNMVGAIDAESLMNADTLSSYGQNEESDDLGAGDIVDAVDDGEEGEIDLEAELGDEGDMGLGDLGGLGGEGDMGLGDEGDMGLGDEGLGGEGDMGLEGDLGEGDMGLGDEGDLDLGDEGSDEEDQILGLESKDIYGDYAITEDQDISDDYGVAGSEENAMEDVVSDLRNLFESGSKPWEKDGKDEDEKDEKDEEIEKDDDSVIKEKDDDKPFPGAAKPFGEGKEDIKNKDVISGTEGVKSPEGAAVDSMPKDNGGKIPGEHTLKKDSKLGNKGTDSDCKEIGGKDPIKRDPKNDSSTAVMKENKMTKPTFGKGPFKRVN